MKVTFENIKIVDFQGLRDFSLDFEKSVTRIFGENGVGKTTILDAIYWVFFGKNSLGKKTFDIDPLDEENNPIPDTKPSVELTIFIDGEETVLKREKGKSVKCYIDGVPKKVGDFAEFIEEFISEKLFMTMINPVFFGNEYTWQEQKALILDKFSITDTAIEHEKFSRIKGDIKKLGVDDAKAKYDAQIKDYKKKIDGSNGTIKYLTEALVGKQIDETKDELTKQKDAITEQLLQLKGIEAKRKQFNEELLSIERDILGVENSKKSLSNEILILSSKKDQKTTNYKHFVAEKNTISDKCTLCGNTLSEKEIQEQKDKIQKKIDAVIEEGKSIALQIDSKKLELNKITTDELEEKKKAITEKLSQLGETSYSELMNQQSVIVEKISSYDTINKHSEDLKEEKTKVAEYTKNLDIAEGMLTLIKDYHKEYSQLVANEINSKLTEIQIKTFNEQKDGNLKETFEITRNGIPYRSVNAAGKITAGVELIQLLKETLDLDFPIVIDNKESITKNFDVSNQIITMTVKEGAVLGK